MQRYTDHQKARGSSKLSPTSDLSKATDSLQKLNLGSSSKQLKNSISTIPEDGFTTVDYSKPGRDSTRIKSVKLGSNSNQLHEPRAMPAIGKTKITFTEPEKRSGVPSAAATSRASAYTASNWREPRLQVPVFKGVDQTTPRVNGAGNRHTPKKKYPREFYRPGIIIRAALHEEEAMGANSTLTTAKATSKCITPSQHGNIFSVPRKMIVVATFEKHYIAIPLFTHNGRGLAHKNAEEYISVRDHRDGWADFQALSEHGMLMTEFLHDGVDLFDRMSTAHITYPLSRKYDYPVIHEGHLERDAIKHLIMLYDWYTPKEVSSRK